MEENLLEWPSINDGVLFAHCVSMYSSKKYSPFKLLYNRKPILPMYVRYKLSTEDLNPQQTSRFPRKWNWSSGDDCIENLINDIIQRNQPLDKRPFENSQNSQISDETPAIAFNGCDQLPDEIVEKIFTQAIKNSDHVCGT